MILSLGFPKADGKSAAHCVNIYENSLRSCNVDFRNPGRILIEAQLCAVTKILSILVNKKSLKLTIKAACMNPRVIPPAVLLFFPVWFGGGGGRPWSLPDADGNNGDSFYQFEKHCISIISP